MRAKEERKGRDMVRGTMKNEGMGGRSACIYDRIIARRERDKVWETFFLLLISEYLVREHRQVKIKNSSRNHTVRK